MFRLIKQLFIGLLYFSKSLCSIVNTSDHVKCISLNNQQYMAKPNLSNLRSNEYIEGLCYYPIAVNLDRCIRSCSTANDLSVCVLNKTEDLSFSIFSMIAGING